MPSPWSYQFDSLFGPFTVSVPPRTGIFTQFNPVPSSNELAFSNNNLTVTQNGSSDAAAFTTYFFNQGNWYWEYLDTIETNPEFAPNRFGVVAMAAISSAAIGNVSYGLGINATIGDVFWDGVNQITVQSCSQGDRMAIALNATSSLIWFRTIHSGIGAAWNNLTSANPATGIGGISFSGASISGLYMCPAASETSTGSQLTGFFSGPFIGAVPAGFLAPTTYGTPPIISILSAV